VHVRKRVARLGIYLLPAVIIGFVAGPPWTYLRLVGAFLPGLCLHAVWSLRQGINPLTSEPETSTSPCGGWDRK
jgi:hypothetical protein